MSALIIPLVVSLLFSVRAGLALHFHPPMPRILGAAVS